MSKPGLGTGLLSILLILSGCRPAGSWHWERAEAGLPHEAMILTLAADPTDPQRLWAGYYAPAGLAVSQDGGETWVYNAEGLGDNPIFELLYLPCYCTLDKERPMVSSWRLPVTGYLRAVMAEQAGKKRAKVCPEQRPLLWRPMSPDRYMLVSMALGCIQENQEAITGCRWRIVLARS
jgi:hypothetical protein